MNGKTIVAAFPTFLCSWYSRQLLRLIITNALWSHNARYNIDLPIYIISMFICPDDAESISPCLYISIYIYRERERERHPDIERERGGAKHKDVVPEFKSTNPDLGRK